MEAHLPARLGETMNSSNAAGATPPSPQPAEQTTPAPSPSTSPGWSSLSTQRLLIVLLRIVWDSHVSALNDKHHMRFSEQRRKHHSRHTQEEYIHSANKDLLLLDLRKPQQIFASVGSMSCWLDHDNKRVDLGIMIVPSECGKNYAMEAWTAVMNYWLGRGYKVEGGCMADNFAMSYIMYKSGMTLEGTRIGHFLLDDGTRAAVLLYGRVPT